MHSQNNWQFNLSTVPSTYSTLFDTFYKFCFIQKWININLNHETITAPLPQNSVSSLANVKYELGREARRIVLEVLQHEFYVETHVVPDNGNVGQ